MEATHHTTVIKPSPNWNDVKNNRLNNKNTKPISRSTWHTRPGNKQPDQATNKIKNSKSIQNSKSSHQHNKFWSVGESNVTSWSDCNRAP